MSFDPKPYAERIKAENAAEGERLKARSLLALREAERLSMMIRKADPSVRRIFLFGSLAEGIPRNPDFDIDLALDGGDVYKALDVVEDSDFKVDLVDLRLLPEHVRKRVLLRGKVLPTENLR